MKKHYLISLLCCLPLCGCSDDSSNTKTQEPEQKTECTTDEDCASGKCLANGKCAKQADEGDVCDDEVVCKGDLECKHGVCTDTSKTGPNPVDENKCSSDDDCDEVTILAKGDDCDASSKTTVCPKDMGCYLGKCMTEDDYNNTDKCHSDDDCANDKDGYTTCLENGLCGAVWPIGEQCGGNQDLCEKGLECYSGVCVQIANEGSECSKEDNILCANNLDCVQGFCRTIEENITKGNECNISYKLCTEGLTCRDDVCIAEKAENEDCNDETFDSCGSGLACLQGKCTPFGDECTTTKDCKEKDSYCCQSDACGLKGRCIPYDDTTKYDETCRYKTKPGIFEAQIQCRWQPPADQFPKSNKVEIPPLVGPFGNKAGLKSVIAVWSFNERCFQASFPSNVTTANHLSVIRFINPETCETLESIKFAMPCSYYNNPAAADIDGDGLLELVVIDENKHPTLYKWDNEQQKHVKKWQHSVVTTGTAPEFFDINNDTKPELIVGSVIIEPISGERVVAGLKDFAYNMGSVGYLFNTSSNMASMVIENLVLQWNDTQKKWNEIAKLPTLRPFTAYADFGTPGADPEHFDYTKLDGTPEIVSGGSGGLNLYALIEKPDAPGTYNVQTLMKVDYSKPAEDPTTTIFGGPITVGDFDSDGLPEIGVASSGYYGVYDPRCTQYEEGKCADKNVLWERWSQDVSSGKTGSSLFDFDGDGQSEAVYADECFTRVYDGKTGKVLFSAKRSSMTSIEAPVIADVDGDGSAEILMGSDINMTCYDDSAKRIDPLTTKNSNCVDPIHEGIACLDDEDCPSGKNCNQSIGLCTCTEDSECNSQFIQGTDKVLTQYVCAPPIHSQVGMMVNADGKGRKLVKAIGTRPDGWKDGDYKVCRATRKTTDIGFSDLMIFKDRLDRWVSSRPLWNQHAYNIINIEDDGKVPSMTTWLNNWVLKNTGLKIEGTDAPRPVYNSFRLNKQGQYGAGAVPDITGRFIAGSICGKTTDDRFVISGKLCNRGTKPVSTKLPASFFYVDESKSDKRGDFICTSYTNAILGVGECDQVGCVIDEAELEKLADKDVLMVTNLDENGFASTVECNADNNTDIIHIDSCKTDDPIEIVN